MLNVISNYVLSIIVKHLNGEDIYKYKIKQHLKKL